ncbi:MAG: transposase, partial [Mycobacteriaceae bacterium]|nr:transposase [Mycobacteriaceae bacterium]
AEKVLWCYANAGRLARRGVYVICADEMPNLQVLEREPIRRAVPGSIEQREFEYARHGTVNLLTFLVVHTGRMRVTTLNRNDAESYIWALRQLRADYGHLHGVYLIHDGGPSHIAAATNEYLSGLGGWWHARHTPAHASWLNQSGLPNNAFGGRHLKRGSWADRGAFVEHIRASGLEYNRLFAHPFEWTWTNQKMRDWFARHST